MIDLKAQVIAAVVKSFPDILPLLSPTARAALKASGDYTGIRAEMSGEIHDAVYDYLTGTGNVTSYRNAMALAVSQAYIAAADAGYQDGGGELPLDDDTAAWARGQLDAQLGFIDQLFESLRELRKEGDVNAAAEALGRANGYGNSLDGFYNEALLRGSKNKMLTFTRIHNTKESCPDCVRLRGQRHRASWWIQHDVVPPKGGGLQCAGGGNCGDALVDDGGNVVTL
jgi:hypothetical protein